MLQAVKIEADPTELEAGPTASPAALPTDVQAATAFQPPAPTEVGMEAEESHFQLELVEPERAVEEMPPALPPDADERAANLPAAAVSILPDTQPAIEREDAEAQPEEPELPAAMVQQAPVHAAGAELQPQPPADAFGMELRAQSRASQQWQSSGHASEDLELALQSLMAVPEIPRASSMTSSEDGGPTAQQLVSPAETAPHVPAAALSLMPSEAEGDWTAPGPAPAAPNRRRSSVSGNAAARAARQRRSLRPAAAGRQAEAQNPAAAPASPRAAGLLPASKSGMGEPAESSADIIAELEAQRVRHAEQVGELIDVCMPGCLDERMPSLRCALIGSRTYRPATMAHAANSWTLHAC